MAPFPARTPAPTTNLKRFASLRRRTALSSSGPARPLNQEMRRPGLWRKEKRRTARNETSLNCPAASLVRRTGGVKRVWGRGIGAPESAPPPGASCAKISDLNVNQVAMSDGVTLAQWLGDNSPHNVHPKKRGATRRAHERPWPRSKDNYRLVTSVGRRLRKKCVMIRIGWGIAPRGFGADDET